MLSVNLEQTMSSVELVKIINELREDGKAEVAHSDFMKKIVKVLGEEVAGKFSGNYNALNGKTNPCYMLPKREAQLMVMSESYKVQAKVYDRMVELEDLSKSVTDPQIATMIMTLQQLDHVKREQASQQLQINEIKAKIKASPTDYYTIAGYASLRGMNMDVKEAAAMGRKASKLSDEMMLEKHKAHSEIFGEVNTYHVDVLCTLFSK